MNGTDDLPHLYRDLAGWWPVLSIPEDYAEEAAFYHRTLASAARRPLRQVLELGSGGGNNASHMKRHCRLTLVDRSAGMLAVSRALNPECEHHEGDMRTVRLERTFDGVFIHDAIDYMTSLADLTAAIGTAYIHCRPGGAALFAPDFTRESFRPVTDSGGHDRDGRSLRYLEWTYDPDPDDTTYHMFMVYALREGDGPPRTVTDLHICGLFGEADWMRLLREAGFEPAAVPFDPGEAGRPPLSVFTGLKPAG